MIDKGKNICKRILYIRSQVIFLLSDCLLLDFQYNKLKCLKIRDNSTLGLKISWS